MTNRFILLPMYAKFAGMEGIIAMADNPSITSLTTLFIYGVIPFNVVKGLALSLVTFLLYKPRCCCCTIGNVRALGAQCWESVARRLLFGQGTIDKCSVQPYISLIRRRRKPCGSTNATIRAR